MKTKTVPNGKVISFKANSEERALIRQIAERAMEMARKYNVKYDTMSFNMDITACHANGNPLDLQKLLNFPDFDFGHDVFGIRSNLDRSTGELKNFFVPRCSLPT